jgi:hypothetical protein
MLQVRRSKFSVQLLIKKRNFFFFIRMWRCGNDGPEIDADQEIQSAVDGVKDQIETKLGKTVSHIVAKRGCKQV